jgi:hypothetical protein
MTSDTLTDGDLYKYATTQVNSGSTFCRASQVNVYGVKVRSGSKAIGALASDRTLDDVSTAIKASTAYSGAGQLDGKTRSLSSVRTGKFQVPKDTAYHHRPGKDNSPFICAMSLK